PGTIARIEGVVVTPSGLIDGDGRRIVVADADGAILVRLPVGVPAPSVGTRIRAVGEVATWYDAPQLALSAAPAALGRGPVVPVVVRRAPGASLEWRLVRVSVRIEDVARDGDAWRAEASLGAGGALPIAGLAGAGIAPDTLVAGATATVTGIVRRAWPTASDRRFMLVPRGPADLAVTLPPAASGGDAPPPDGSAADDPATPGAFAGPGGTGPGTDAPSGTAPGSLPAVALAELVAWPASEVRTGGVVEQAGSTAIALRDGEARAVVVLADGAGGRTFAALDSGAVVNVQGRVRVTGAAPEIVADPAHIVVAPRLVAPDAATVAPDAAEARPVPSPSLVLPAATGVPADAPGLPILPIAGLGGALVAVAAAAAIARAGRARMEPGAATDRGDLPGGAA
ncbi:MAG: OB-fold nucleic acid binding domain-containing protein, partial [Chloroflexota bacterium]